MRIPGLAMGVRAALLGLLLALPAAAQPPGPGRGPGPPGRHGAPGGWIERHAESLGLDAETRAAIAGIVETSRSEGELLREELHVAHETLRGLLERDTPDEAAVMRQADALGALEVEMRKHRLRSMLAIRARLTPEQRAQLVEIRAESPRRRGGRRGMRACRDDLAEVCAEAEDGRATLACLSERWDALSEACRGALERFPHSDPRGFGPRGRGPGPPRP